MKKFNIIVLCFLIFTFSACKGRENKLFDITDEIYNVEDLLFVTDKEIYSQDETVIGYSITNIGNEESGCAADPECFALHMLVDGEWQRVGFKTKVTYNALGRILMPGESESREIELENYFYLPLEPGRYRIAIEGIVSNTFEITE